MATNSQLFAGLALHISPSASLQQASPSSFNSVCIAKKSMTTPFLNPGLGTLQIKNTRVVASYQSRGGRHHRLLVRANLFDRFLMALEPFIDDALSSLYDAKKVSEELLLTYLGMVHRQLEQALANQKHYETEYKAAQTISEQWYENARVLLGKGEEDLARVALKRWITYGDDAKEQKLRFEAERKYNNILHSLTKPVASQILRAVGKERRQDARTATKVSEMSGNVNKSSTLSAFQKMNEKVMALLSEPVIVRLKTDELDKKYALKSTPLDDDLAIAIFKEELAAAAAATTEEEYQPHRWWSPFNDFEVEREIRVLKREIEEKKVNLG